MSVAMRNMGTVASLHADHRRWLSECEFWQQEAEIWGDECEKSKCALQQILDKLDRHCNSLSVHAEALSILKKKIKEQEERLVAWQREGTVVDLQPFLAQEHHLQTESQSQQCVAHEMLKKQQHLTIGYLTVFSRAFDDLLGPS